MRQPSLPVPVSPFRGFPYPEDYHSSPQVLMSSFETLIDWRRTTRTKETFTLSCLPCIKPTSGCNPVTRNTFHFRGLKGMNIMDGNCPCNGPGDTQEWNLFASYVNTDDGEESLHD
jgi:hypothetical protein